MKVTIDSITARIKDATYSVLADGRTTVCQLTMVNGYSVNGLASCVDIREFDEAKGQQQAYRDAFAKCWALEGYLLMERAYQLGQIGAPA